MKICLIHPGHAATTAWVYDGYKKYLERVGVEVMECRTDRLLSFSSTVLGKSDIPFDGEQGATAEKWNLHVAQQFTILRIMDCVSRGADVVVNVCGKIISPQNYRLFDMIHANKVVMLTESPYEDAAQVWYSQFHDFAFVNDLLSVPVIGAAVPAAYMPHGYDPDIFHPDSMDKEFDVSFIGTPFGNRRIILQSLRYAPDLNPFIFDSTVYDDEESKSKLHVFVPQDSAASCYHRTKVNLNIHRTETFFGNGEHITQAYSLGPRAFEIAGCAEFQLCDNTRPELVEIFGDTVATYNDPAEVVEQVRYWSDGQRDSVRRDMAMASYEIVQRHTYQDRARRLVAQLAAWYNRDEWIEQESNVQDA